MIDIIDTLISQSYYLYRFLFRTSSQNLSLNLVIKKSIVLLPVNVSFRLNSKLTNFIISGNISIVPVTQLAALNSHSRAQLNVYCVPQV
jgi:hypothetical protein